MRFPEKTPECFDNDEQYQLWVEQALVNNNEEMARHYCEDCQAFYRDDMILQGRCDYPSTAFSKVRGDFVQGVRYGDYGHRQAALKEDILDIMESGYKEYVSTLHKKLEVSSREIYHAIDGLVTDGFLQKTEEQHGKGVRYAYRRILGV